MVNPGRIGCIYGLLQPQIAMERSRTISLFTNSHTELLTASLAVAQGDAYIHQKPEEWAKIGQTLWQNGPDRRTPAAQITFEQHGYSATPRAFGPILTLPICPSILSGIPRSSSSTRYQRSTRNNTHLRCARRGARILCNSDGRSFGHCRKHRLARSIHQCAFSPPLQPQSAKRSRRVDISQSGPVRRH